MKRRSAVALAGILLLTLTAFGAASKRSTQAALQKQAKITMSAAKKIALDKEPGRIKSSELEKEKGKLIYSFDISTKDAIHEVNVDAVTGDVVEDSIESAQAEAKEKRQDEAKAKARSKK